ncbi:hypothetical protein Q760_06610 [Cellulomonas cellasea DSM 20118]|uniref:Uncharacterized protein n=1 Tax=Cellulomonas cellasea DSM 20118 TaxID=1408250 RepID=A0A0A0B8U4_9CELL|nr:hypothetical protein Q760_06610 [Cellulomonas cellasea DSM 20118]
MPVKAWVHASTAVPPSLDGEAPQRRPVAGCRARQQ